MRMFFLRPGDLILFDGSDPTVSFADFIRSIDVTLDMAHERADDVLPTFLYGDALRFYETLDPECQHNWEKLSAAMGGRFPGKWRAEDASSSFLTPADGPPSGTTPRRAPSPSRVVPESEGKREVNTAGNVVEKGLKHKKSDVWIGKLKDKLRIPSFARSPKSDDDVVGPSNASRI